MRCIIYQAHICCPLPTQSLKNEAGCITKYFCINTIPLLSNILVFVWPFQRQLACSLVTLNYFASAQENGH